MFTTDMRHGTISMTVSKSRRRSYEEFVEDFMNCWLDELTKRGEETKALIPKT